MKWLMFFASAGGGQKPSLTGEVINNEWSFNPPWWVLVIVALLVIVKLIYASRKD